MNIRHIGSLYPKQNGQYVAALLSHQSSLLINLHLFQRWKQAAAVQVRQLCVLHARTS
jgi:hypothetical protein